MDTLRSPTVISFVVGVVVGVLGFTAYAWLSGGALAESARVRVVEGYTDGVNETGTAIGLAPRPHCEPDSCEGYILSGADWSSTVDNVWHEGFDAGREESCVPPLSSGQRLLMGVVDVPGSAESAGGRSHVVWFQCLSGPSGIHRR